ncbi:MAG: HPr family phosphocarrier protein [Clostridia bacterium]|nr:HPr family phosphocarrier protein [Clostridia bacterium]
MKEFTHIVKDEIGLHARPAGALSKIAKEFKSEIIVEKSGNQVNATKLMMLMGLGIKQNDLLTIKISGEDEQEALTAIQNFFINNL